VTQAHPNRKVPENYVDNLNTSRGNLISKLDSLNIDTKPPAEGGCGVVGLASEVPINGRILVRPLAQMRNRGNGKGGGVAMAGLDPIQWGVSSELLKSHYLIGIAYLEESIQDEVEERFVNHFYDVSHTHVVETVEDFNTIPGIDVQPPKAVLYFVLPKEEKLLDFTTENKLEELDKKTLMDEFVYQISFSFNVKYYASDAGNQAFVMCHGKDLLVLKMVGYAEDVITYYKLENKSAHVWIGHHRYPTKGKVWHPGGAHPFIGLNEALVHNGDFANYQSICDYLAQRNIKPLFMTDTEVSALVYDLHRRTYNYPLEYVIESLAPTTELDFELLDEDKKEIYSTIQHTHIHGSPDGPWFFIIAESLDDTKRLIGITDTSMLRPQVFAVQRGKASIGFCASEKQVIDAVLEELSAEDDRFWDVADHYWVARGGSHTDGGAFSFTLEGENKDLVITNKFNEIVNLPTSGEPYFGEADIAGSGWNPESGLKGILEGLEKWDSNQAIACLDEIESLGKNIDSRGLSIKLLNSLHDLIYPLNGIRRSAWISLIRAKLHNIFESIRDVSCNNYQMHKKGEYVENNSPEQTIILNASNYEIEGEKSIALELVDLYKNNWRKFIVTECHGHRFIGCGFGPRIENVTIDVYGSSGDYLCSGNDGMTINVHGDGQDQLCQIMKSGKLVVYGGVGQAFGYGAKGGEVYVRDNAAGRPMINAVGSPKILINGTCLDYLAESFMAGDPLDGGGFVILNGVSYNDEGILIDMQTPYPGSNLFSLASGGAMYIRDPLKMIGKGQLNGGEWEIMQLEDWTLIKPYLEENERLFGITIERLLTVDGVIKPFNEVYRKARPAKTKALQAEEAWVAHAK
jgi:glutamate synthase domain-containing protein 1/glutamate synthase domain-containing protein 3